jgi:predicted PolB exonuclease-like 3'-5' exonuclease
MNILTFDIETVPDIESAKRLYDFHNLSADEIAQALFQIRRQETGSDWLKPYLHRVVAISLVLHTAQQCRVWSLGEIESSEEEIISRFYEGIEKFTPTLVSWNGYNFDLPVLHYRALLHGITAKRYWEIGDNDQRFRWNNYLNRYHERHIDLMDILAGYNSRNTVPLDDLAVVLGLPGKMSMHGSLVWDYYQRGDIMSIRNYCETDVLNTHLVFLRFQKMRGQYTQEEYQQRCHQIETMLAQSSLPHLHEFMNEWKRQR